MCAWALSRMCLCPVLSVLDPVGWWRTGFGVGWAGHVLCGVVTSLVGWSECHLSAVTHLVPLSVCCCWWLPQALLFPLLAAAVLEPLLPLLPLPLPCSLGASSGRDGTGGAAVTRLPFSSHLWSPPVPELCLTP